MDRRRFLVTSVAGTATSLVAGAVGAQPPKTARVASWPRAPRPTSRRASRSSAKRCTPPAGSKGATSRSTFGIPVTATVSGFAPELSGKRLELIRQLFPRADRVAVLTNRANPATIAILRATESAAQQIRMTLHVTDVRQAAELGAAFETMRREHADALLILADPLLFAERPQIVQLAARHRLPAIYETRLFPESGGLLSYGPLVQERFERMAVYVDRILRGARPGDLPIEQPSKFELVINLKTAKALGLTIAPSVLLRADQVIE